MYHKVLHSENKILMAKKYISTLLSSKHLRGKFAQTLLFAHWNESDRSII